VSLIIALLCLLFLGAALLMVVLNHAAVDVNLFFHNYAQVPVAVVMVLSLLTGIVFASLISILDGIRIRVQNRRLRKRVLRLEDELVSQRRVVRDRHPESESTPPPDYLSP
jgi:uncharacterized integral membrane protein